MKRILVVQAPSEAEAKIIEQYYRFIKWFKRNYHSYYTLYATRIIIPYADLKIAVSMAHVAPEDKQPMREIINEFNQGKYD